MEKVNTHALGRRELVIEDGNEPTRRQEDIARYEEERRQVYK